MGSVADSELSPPDHQMGHVSVVRRIPKHFHAADLRHFFSDPITRSDFACFHFMHRPDTESGKPRRKRPRSVGEGRRKRLGTTIDDPEPIKDEESDAKHNCCLVQLSSSLAASLFESDFNGRAWFDRHGDTLIAHERCLITPFTNPVEDQDRKYLTKRERRENAFTQTHQLPELNPPPGLPQGNVGTPEKAIQDAFAKGIVPPQVLARLGVPVSKPTHSCMLDFKYAAPKSFSNRSLSRGVMPAGLAAPSLSRPVSQLASLMPKPTLSSAERKKRDQEAREVWKSRMEERMRAPDEEAAEEWDRYLTEEGQDFNEIKYGRDEKEHYLFEEEEEQVWEKGGSGLVFHTDAAYWEAQRGDQDEKWADGFDPGGFVDQDSRFVDRESDGDGVDVIDWDAEGEGVGAGEDKNDTIAMIRSWASRPAGATHHTPRQQQHPAPSNSGPFTGLTREQGGGGVAVDLMRRMGWRAGGGLGKEGGGITDAVVPTANKRKFGLGYDSAARKASPHQPAGTAAPSGRRAYRKVPKALPAELPVAKTDGSFSLADEAVLNHAQAHPRYEPLQNVDFRFGETLSGK